MTAFDHAGERIGEPLFEFPMTREDVGHQEMHQRPQLHQAGKVNAIDGFEKRSRSSNSDQSMEKQVQ